MKGVTGLSQQPQRADRKNAFHEILQFWAERPTLGWNTLMDTHMLTPSAFVTSFLWLSTLPIYQTTMAWWHAAVNTGLAID